MIDLAHVQHRVRGFGASLAGWAGSFWDEQFAGAWTPIFSNRRTANLNADQNKDGGASAALPRLEANERRSERILIYRLGSLGDTIVALPCFHKIAEVFPNAERWVLTNKPVSSKAAPLESILADSGLIDGTITYPVGLRSVKGLAELRSKLKKLEAKTLIYLTPPRGRIHVHRDLFYFRLCGVKKVIGAPTSREERWRIDGSTGHLEQECARLARNLGELGMIDLDDRANWDLRLTDRELEAGNRTLAPFCGRTFIAVNMGGKLVEQHWGDDNWRRFFTELAKTHGEYGLLFVGVAEDAYSVAKVTESWPGEIVNACGLLTPRESAAAIGRARLFMGHDSGPMHLAAACGVPCMGLFGSSNKPKQWHPYGDHHRAVHHEEGIETISVAEVVEVAHEVCPMAKP